MTNLPWDRGSGTDSLEGDVRLGKVGHASSILCLLHPMPLHLVPRDGSSKGPFRELCLLLLERKLQKRR